MSNPLTGPQNKASQEIEKNVQIIACAGSGKTTTMVERIINLLKEPDINPKNVVAFTFTDKAANELKERAYKVVNEKLGNTTGLAEIYIGTIHGYCLNLLQEYSSEYTKYEIINEIQTKLFVDKTYNINGFKEIQYTDKQKNVSSLKRFIDTALYLEVVNTIREADILEIPHVSIPANILKAVKMYEQALDNNFYFDYTSILLKAIALIQNNNEVKEKVKNELNHLIIDEYQDVNPIQEKLINTIYSLKTNICVVGDDDQILYHWRGSKSENIVNFSNRYENVEKIELLENFRSSKGIVNTAALLINHNQDRLAKTMISANNQNYDKFDVLGNSFNSEKDEIDFIVRKIKQLIGVKFNDNPKEPGRGLSYSDIAILVYSVKKIPKYLIEQLSKENIKFVVEGMKNLFEASEIQASVNIFYFLADQYSLNDLLNDWSNQTFSVDKTSLDKAVQELISLKVKMESSAWEDFILQDIYKKFLEQVGIFNLDENEYDRTLYNFAKFTEVINDYETIHMRNSPINKVIGFCSFLKYAASDYYPEGWLSPSYRSTKGLKIMTFFQAKGLEFPVVIMPFLTQSFMFPPKKGGKNKWAIIGNILNKTEYESNDEDLRRLFYVGVTRSKKFLFMSQSPHPIGDGSRFYSKPAKAFIEILHSNYVNQDPNFDHSKLENAPVIDKINKDVINLDFSTLKDYFECSLRFKYSSIYGFIQPLSYRMGFGKSMHNMLEDLHKNFRDSKQSVDELVNVLIDKHFHIPYAARKLKDSMELRARRDMTNYIRLNRHKFNQIIYVEKQIEISLTDEVFVNGRIDLVRNTETNTTTIIDFKSDTSTQSDELIVDQLAIYALGYKKLTGLSPNYVESYTLENNYPKQITVNEALLENIEKKIMGVKESIELYQFQKVKDYGKDNPICKGCNFKDACLK
ncbi:ATP-dependent DNA helicase [Bacillus horti]|uniref:DNA 3'-5' helicase n=1 Tax=Caldalkalibacillus horti TaxID=77523 RepID=A0ABT9VYR1_9BACI|nr:ATP-dependent DNA helicase [Bacillus horti]MDQ0166134.1 DNA helicase-2/ATP-dependent DNA helicase PcrA [Bacillus horti]